MNTLEPTNFGYLTKEQFLADREMVEEFKNEPGYPNKYKTDEEAWQNYRGNCFGTVLLLAGAGELGRI